jgi:hypothetical protein
MPNGGFHFCANCSHFAAEGSVCSLRNLNIEIPYRTTCRNFNQPGGDARGPLYAMISEVKNRSGWHGEIPYWDGCRVETLQLAADTVVHFEDATGQPHLRLAATGDTIVRFRDAAGKTREFPSVVDYLRFYTESGHAL